MMTRDEFYTMVEELERSANQLLLLVLHFQRVGRETWPEPPAQPEISPPWTNK
jgi:hypothetical protein